MSRLRFIAGRPIYVLNTLLNVLNSRRHAIVVSSARGACMLGAGRRPPWSQVLSESADLIEFGPFRLDAARRTLWRAGEPVTLSSRGFDILALLVEKRGRIVTKDEILATVWRGMIVEENNLAVQVSALRRALADGGEASWILTVPGQGYRFVGAVARPVPPVAPAPSVPEPPAMAMPVPPIARGTPRRWPWLAAAGAAAALIAVVTLRHPAAPKPPAAPRLSIAVLPFRDLSDDRCCDYLADAITDDLTTDLSHIPGSTVIARESSDAFRGRALPTGEIGRALNVRTLLEGSLRAVEGQFSINAQLIDATTGAHLWAERFTVPRAGLAEAQDAIVHRIASALGVTLVDIEGARAARERAVTPDALDLYLRARSILDRTDTLDGMSQAQALLEQALAKQPDDVKVLSELGWLLAMKINNFVEPRPADDLARARQVAARALALAPDNPNALAAQGAMLAFDGKCTEAEHLYEAALAADPANIRALTGLVVCHGVRGEFRDMADRLTTLIKIDPEGPRKRVRYQQLGFADLMLGRPADALPWLERALAGAPIEAAAAEDLGTAEWARLSLIAAARLTGDTARSDALFAAYRTVWPHRTLWTLQAYTPKPIAQSAGFEKFLGALRDAGMPRFADEGTDWGVLPGPPGRKHAMLSPTPLAVPGIRTLRTDLLAAQLKAGDGPALLDFGVGAALPPGARRITLDPADTAAMAALATTLRKAGRPAAVMGTGPLDWRSYDAAVALAAQPGLSVAWYRGGEEAWAEAGLAAQDAR